MGLFDRLFGKKKEEEEPLAPLSEGEETLEEDFDRIQEAVEADFEQDVTSFSETVQVHEDLESGNWDTIQEAVEASFEDQMSPAPVSIQDQEDIGDQDWDTVQEAVEASFEADVAAEEKELLEEEPIMINGREGEISEFEVATPVPSSLERAVEILRDKEKRAAAVREAEEKRAEEERLAQERALLAQEEVQHELEIQETTQEKYDRSLKKTRTGFGAKLNAFFANFRTVDEEFFEDLEELLITSDVGVQVATALTESLRQEAKLENVKKGEELRRVVIEKLVDIYEQDGDFESEKIHFQEGLTVMLFVGVNGVGKTTSIGKLANQYKKAGKKVMLVAADTFRAGAVAQLAEWARRVDVDIVTGPEKSDPASVVYDGMERAVAQGVDVLMIDTAGRLQNKDNLMAELEKIGRIIKRVLPDAPHETLLALDASTGQNALVQAKEFSKITPLTGLVLTKIDGTARGGVVLAIRQELDIPVKLIGFGEKLDDIGQFNSEDFMRGLLEGLI